MKKRMEGSATELPRVVLFYNQWTGFEHHGIREQFRPMTLKEIRALEPGDAVYFNEDPIHPNGKVYGFVRRRIARVEAAGKGFKPNALRVHHDAGYTTVDPKGYNELRVVKRPQALAALVAAHPQCTVVFP